MYEDEIVVMLGASVPSESKSKHLISVYKRVLSQFRTLLSNKSIHKYLLDFWSFVLFLYTHLARMIRKHYNVVWYLVFTRTRFKKKTKKCNMKNRRRSTNKWRSVAAISTAF